MYTYITYELMFEVFLNFFRGVSTVMNNVAGVLFWIQMYINSVAQLFARIRNSKAK